MSRNRCPSNNFITFSRLRAFTMAEITWRGGQNCERKFRKLSPPPSQENSDQVRRGKSFMKFSRIHPSIRGCHGTRTNFQFRNTCDREFWLRLRLSPILSPHSRRDLCFRENIYSNIYLHIGGTYSASANFKLFRAIRPTMSNKEKK